MHKIAIAIVFIVVFCTNGRSQSTADLWVDSLMNNWSEDQKLGQLFMIRAMSNSDTKHKKSIEKLIKEEHIGGLCFFQGTPAAQARLTNGYQKLSETPLFISVDGEWGLGMRFKKHGFSFPRQIMLGAMMNDNLLYNMGQAVAKHCKTMGIHINFAPVVDVNNNPANPVIGDRSFGEDKYNVAAKSYAYMKGMQDGGIMACAKHFPGHGDTDVDSHLSLPVINHDRKRLDSLELMPFESMIQQGIQSIMVAHLHVPILDNRENRATTLSRNTVTNILKNELQFNGLIFTDALDMKGVASHFKTGQVDAEALLAGNDILLLSEDVKKAKKYIKKYIKKGMLTQEQVDQSVRKILIAKYNYGLHKSPKLEDIDKLESLIKDPGSIALRTKMAEQAMTLVKNDTQIIPINPNTKQTYGSISIGSKTKSTFQKSLSKFVKITDTHIGKSFSESLSNAIYRQMSKKEVVFIDLQDLSRYASKNYGISDSAITLINKLRVKTKVILVIFGSPYTLKYFDQNKNVLLAYQEEDYVQDVAAQALFGVSEINGHLPVTASDTYPLGTGLYSPSTGILGYAQPESVGMSSDTLQKIDAILDEMISKKAAPGGQVLIARNGRVVFNKAYGNHTYAKKNNRAVKLSDLYDVASVTKILATTISIMKLEEDNLIDIEKPIGTYIADLDTCQNKDLPIKDILAHHAGLRGWIPFYKSTLTDDKRPKRIDSLYSDFEKDGFNIEIARKLFLRNDYRDSVWHRVYTCSIRDTNDYKYSDLGFYMLSKIIKDKTQQSLDEYTANTFYKPLGLKRTSFLPLKTHRREEVAPSEEDTYFRNQVLQGHVHDMGAAMLGGVSGHAGLFSNSQGLAVLMQMLLNGGNYGGKKYLEPNTILKYTQRHPLSTRRGIGFDMKQLDTLSTMNISELASDKAYGHLGFTGTSVFADPEYNTIFIFLTNRTFPTMENKRFARSNYRPRVQSIMYEAILPES